MSTSTRHKSISTLVDHLKWLAEHREDNPYARATLAQLRASLSPERRLTALHLVLPHLDASSRRRERDEDDALLLAGLFALHPEDGEQSLAAALRRVATASQKKFEENGSTALRFRALLNASREDLDAHLRAAVALSAAEGEAINWQDLEHAIRAWGHDDAQRRRWARDFWIAPNETVTNLTLD